MGKVYLSNSYKNKDVLQISRKELKNPKIIRIEENANSFDIITNWSEFNVSVQQNILEIKPRWNKEKFVMVISLIITGLIFWIPLLVLMTLVYLEYKNCKELEVQIVDILSKGKKEV